MQFDLSSKEHSLHKILFRFFFVFFILEILTQDFLGNWWLGKILSLWQFGEKIFTAPFFWLNNHIFHLYYNPEGWTTFSASLVFVRDLTYLFVAVIVCLFWTIFDKKTDYDKLNFWFSKALAVCLSCTMMVYGLIKIFPLQMHKPTFAELQSTVGDLSPFDLLWMTFGYGAPYQIFTGLGEVLCAFLILFNRTKLPGLLILLVLLSNILMVNYTYVIGVTALSFLLLLITCYLLLPYLGNLWCFFFTDHVTNHAMNLRQYKLTTPWKRYAVTTLTVALVATNFLFTAENAYSRYSNAVTINESRKYSEIKNFSVNGDTLQSLIVNDTIRWRYWTEKTVKGELTATISFMDHSASKIYYLTRDSLNHNITLKPYSKKDTVLIQLTYKDTDKFNWHLEGLMGGKTIAADLQKISPDTTLRLLRIKRHIVDTDQAEY